jgi:hypothetical protein
MKYIVCSIDRYDMTGTEIEECQSDLAIEEFFYNFLDLDEDFIKEFKANEDISINEEGTELAVDGEEYGYFVKKV